MLTVSQVRTVGARMDGGLFCSDCAARSMGEIRWAKAQAGLTGDISGRDIDLSVDCDMVSAYELSEWESSDAYERARERAADGEFEEDSEEFEKAVEDYRIQCDGCGRYFTGGGAQPWSDAPGGGYIPDGGENSWLW